MVCGGTLHRGNYQRKTRGFGPGVDAECLAGEPGPDLRLSFCCEREGCRTRHTPASVRFLGRHVYAAVIREAGRDRSPSQRECFATTARRNATPARRRATRPARGTAAAPPPMPRAGPGRGSPEGE